jgi:hypothetical protein
MALLAKRIRCTLRDLRVYHVNGLRQRPGRDPRRSIFIHRGAAARRPLAYFVVKLACGLYEARDRWVCLVGPEAYSSTIVDRNPDA